jgi:hypothetical protein
MRWKHFALNLQALLSAPVLYVACQRQSCRESEFLRCGESHNEGWITTVIALASPRAISAAAAQASLLDLARKKKKSP